MTLLQQAKIYIISATCSPWVMAFMSENVLPSGGAYDLARIASFIFWLGAVFFIGGYLFIENGREIVNELKGSK